MEGVPVVPDPTALYRIRDSAYATDLLVAAVAELDLFSLLAGIGPTTASELCGELGLAARPADVLLTLCAARGLVDRDLASGDLIRVTDLARAHLTAGSPYDLRAYYRSLAERPGVQELVRVLRTDRPAAWASSTAGGAVTADRRDWSGRLVDPDFAGRITAAMDARGAFLGPALADTLADLPCTGLLDIGGSSGVYAAALIEKRATARAAVVERPPVDAAARSLLEARGLAGRIEVIGADMFSDPLPAGYDLHLYSQVLHDWDRERVAQLLAASFEALPPGGWLVDHDTHIDADKSGPLPVAEYSVLLMHSTPGKCWSVGELSEMTAAAGFVDARVLPTVADRSAFLVRKPG
ncbi:acetylserotonin O-methyltransferase [Pseudonocardia sp. ICBG601]|uniref:acetylserotonin O-methyltransferase n=1 Tax=Pseudonocardia sp. ICBG601 TaxID=2846759 RepID=UPI001CF65A4E|nr:acetylserotonin O-methyltransferase [Pseudonocardia sp. ICBG601]